MSKFQTAIDVAETALAAGKTIFAGEAAVCTLNDGLNDGWIGSGHRKSHVTIPQPQGMHANDLSRKDTLGLTLASASMSTVRFSST